MALNPLSRVLSLDQEALKPGTKALLTAHDVPQSPLQIFAVQNLPRAAPALWLVFIVSGAHLSR